MLGCPDLSMENLTERQRLFVEAYLATRNASEAARQAGYRSPATEGYRLLRNEQIGAAIQARLGEIRGAMGADEVIQRLSDQARHTIEDFIEISPETGYPSLDFAKAQRLGKLHLIKKISYDKQGRVICEFHDPTRALELLGKHHRLFIDRVETQNQGETRVVVEYEDAPESGTGDADDEGG
jgi:phage terminase small subunit